MLSPEGAGSGAIGAPEWLLPGAGYFARWAGLRVLVDQFLGGAAHTQGGPGAGAQGSVPLDGLQIVSLGSGYDTLFFQLKVRPD